MISLARNFPLTWTMICTLFCTRAFSSTLGQDYLFNTVIAALMELSNTLSKFTDTKDTSMAVRKESLHILLKTLSPIAPHLCHHLWQELGHKTAIVNEPWPSVDTAIEVSLVSVNFDSVLLSSMSAAITVLNRCLRSISSVIFLSVW
jgi:leucyl-tRNA synthetase